MLRIRDGTIWIRDKHSGSATQRKRKDPNLRVKKQLPIPGTGAILDLESMKNLHDYQTKATKTQQYLNIFSLGSDIEPYRRYIR